MKHILICILFSFSSLGELFADAEKQLDPKKIENKETMVKDLMSKIHERISKYHWDYSLFPQSGWEVYAKTVDKTPLIYFKCGAPEAKHRSLILSAVHGDEITPVYYGFRLVEWIKARPEICENNFVVIAPIVNPDGFLRYTTGTRTNYNKVDLNRNFSTPEWKASAQHLWKSKYSGRRRYFPGENPDSEPETLFQKWLIYNFKPQKILSVHAPLNFLDYDGPKEKIEQEFTDTYLDSCKDLKYTMMKATPDLRYHAYGTFPGSLGNYAGKWLGIPTLTAELPTTHGSRAGAYFGLLEKATKKFIEFKIDGSPKSLDEKIATGTKLLEAKAEETTINSRRHQ